MGLIREVEELLRREGKPYIAVDEAKKALFSGAKLKSFHFVVYFPEGSNWLVSCAGRGAENLAEMRQWQAIFGDGFKAVFALRRKSSIAFVDAQGKELAVLDVGLAVKRQLPPAVEPEPISPHSHPSEPETFAPRPANEVPEAFQTTLF